MLTGKGKRQAMEIAEGVFGVATRVGFMAEECGGAKHGGHWRPGK